MLGRWALWESDFSIPSQHLSFTFVEETDSKCVWGGQQGQMAQGGKDIYPAPSHPESLPTTSQARDTLAPFQFLQKAKFFPASRSFHTSLSELPLILQVITEMSGAVPPLPAPT